MSRGNKFGFGVVAVAVAALAGVVLHGSPKQPAYTPRNPLAGNTIYQPPPLPAAVFLGDSYTAGADASAGKSYVDVLSNHEGWQPVNLGVGSTGWLSRGDYSNGHDHTNYLDRVPKVIAAKPKIVIVSGGRNDDGLPAEQIGANAAAVLAQIHQGLPTAKIVVFGPSWSNAPAPVDMPAIDGAIRLAAQRAHVPFVDETDWWPSTVIPDYFSDGANIHPNNAGHAYLARRMQDALAALKIN